jgi:serine/threonine protein kinase
MHGNPLVIGDYVLGQWLGTSGRAGVFAAEHRAYHYHVAVTVVPLANAPDREAIAAAFERETAKLSALQHPNLVRVLDGGYDPARRCCYLVAEIVYGGTLAEKLREAGSFDEATLRRYAAEIADGLAIAHACDVAHRQLTLDSIGFGPGGELKVGGFSLMGTSYPLTERVPVYAAPEAIAWDAIGPSVDMWALGVLLFQLRTGRLPFGHDGIRNRRVYPELLVMRGFSPALARLTRSCLAVDPNCRPASMAALARTLRALP